MAATFGFHRGSSYKMFFTKLDEFHATATNGQKYQLLTDQDYQHRFFDFLCKEYHPQYESSKKQVATYDAGKLLLAIKDLAGKHRGAQPKIDINGLPRVLLYGISAINTATVKKINNVSAGPWSATDFGTWETPTPNLPSEEAAPQPRAPLNGERSAPNVVDDNKNASVTQGLGKRKRALQDEVTSVANASEDESGSTISPEPMLKRQKQQANVQTSICAPQTGHTANVNHENAPRQQASSSKPVSTPKAHQERHLQQPESPPWIEPLGSAAMNQKMKDLYNSINVLAYLYYDQTGAVKTEMMAPLNLKKIQAPSPELRLIWSRVLGKNAEQSMTSDTEGAMTNIDLIKSVIGIFITHAIFLGELDVFKWPDSPRLTEKHLNATKNQVNATVDATVDASTKSGESVQESLKQRIGEHINDLAWYSGALIIDSPNCRDPENRSTINVIARNVAHRILEVLEPHMPLLYKDDYTGEHRPYVSLYTEWREGLEGVIRQAFAINDKLNVKAWPYSVVWIDRDEPFDNRYMQPYADYEGIREGKKYKVNCTFLPSIVTWCEYGMYRAWMPFRAMVKLTRLPDTESAARSN